MESWEVNGAILKKPITSMERDEKEGGNKVAVEIYKVFFKMITFIKINSSLLQPRKTTQKEEMHY